MKSALQKLTWQRNCLNISFEGCEIDNLTGCFRQADEIALQKKMKHLTIIVPNGENSLSSITGAYEIFNKANEHWKARKKRELFIIQLAGISDKVEFNAGLF